MAEFWHEEQQREEAEVLASIYGDRLCRLSDAPLRLRIGVRGSGGVALDLEVTLTPTYPDELPDFAIIVTSGRLPDLDGLRRHVLGEAERSLGMAMVFTMVSYIEEWLAEHLKPIPTASIVKSSSTAAASRPAEDVPLSMRGGPVNAETFEAWRTKFAAEMEQGKKSGEQRPAEAAAAVAAGKLTGRQLFEQNKVLATSDVAFLGDTDAVLDESAFEGLDTLDLEDDEGLDRSAGSE